MAAETRSNYYRYIVSTCTILIPDKDPIHLENNNILGFAIEKDFDNDFFPIFDLQLSLPYTVYYSIVENKTTVRFKVKLEKYAYNDENKIKYKEVVFDTIFSTFIDDDISFMDKDLYEQTLKRLGTAENRGAYDFYLFKDADIKSSKKIINRVVTSSNMTNCIVYLLSKSGSTNVLMTPLDNSKVYNEILLPPTTVIQSISYLEKQFGFYNHGTILFYDFDTVYFINKRAECTAYRTGEFKDVIVYVFKSLSENAKTPGTFKDNETKTYTLHIAKDNTEMLTSSVVNDQITGTNVTVINPLHDSQSSVNPDVQSRNSTTTMLIDNFNNKYLNKMIDNAKYENDHIVEMTVTDVDLNCFAPNKKYIMSFEDKATHKAHSGNYRLSHMLFTFVKNGDFFITNGEVQFKKTT